MIKDKLVESQAALQAEQKGVGARSKGSSLPLWSSGKWTGRGDYHLCPSAPNGGSAPSIPLLLPPLPFPLPAPTGTQAWGRVRVGLGGLRSIATAPPSLPVRQEQVTSHL